MNTFLNVFKEIIAENEQREANYNSIDSATRLPQLQRNLHVDVLPEKAVIFTGVRRSGKSTLMRQLIQSLKAKQTLNVIHINFVDNRLTGIAVEHLSELIDAFYLLHPEVPKTLPLYLFLDEIQFIPNWEFFVERQLRVPNRQVFITGSSSRLLSREIASAMRGRSLSYEIFPFSFQEILEWEGFSLSKERVDQVKIQARLEKYIREGGFPEVVPLKELTRIKILQEYYEVLLFRDIIERNEVSYILLVRRFLNLLIQQFAAQMTINKTSEKLKSIGLQADKTKVSDMLNWAEDCYLLFSVQVLSESVTRQNVNPKKIYCIDNGLINAVTSGAENSRGRLLENAVFLHFRRGGHKIHYFKDHWGKEVDFVIDGKALYQVSESLQNPDTRAREVDSLACGMSGLGVKEGTIITLSETEEIQVPEGTIHVIPVRELLLNDAKAQ